MACKGSDYSGCTHMDTMSRLQTHAVRILDHMHSTVQPDIPKETYDTLRTSPEMWHHLDSLSRSIALAHDAHRRKDHVASVFAMHDAARHCENLYNYINTTYPVSDEVTMQKNFLVSDAKHAAAEHEQGALGVK